jgi:hypothetical protein
MFYTIMLIMLLISSPSKNNPVNQHALKSSNKSVSNRALTANSFAPNTNNIITPQPSTTPETKSERSSTTATELANKQGVADSSGFWSQLLPNLLGALFGAILAIPAGLWLDRKIKNKEQKQHTLLILRAVLDELIRNKRSIEDYLNKDQSDYNVGYPNVITNAWKAAQNQTILATGDDYEMHKNIFTVYERLDFLSSIGQSLWTMVFNVSNDVQALEGRVEILNRILRKEAEDTLPKLKTCISDINNTLKSA